MKLSVIKMLALGFALTVTAPWIASAADEGGKGGGHGRGECLQAALDKLNLNDDQKAKIKDIMDKAAADRQAFAKEHADELKAAKESGDRDKMRSVFAPMREKMKAKILTPMILRIQVISLTNHLRAGASPSLWI